MCGPSPCTRRYFWHFELQILQEFYAKNPEHYIFDRESAVLPRRAAPEASFLREAAAWSLEVKLKAMESEQFSLSLPPSPRHHRASSPVQFSVAVVLHPARTHGTLFPSGWRIFYIPWPPDSEDFGATSLDFLQPSSQEAWPSPAYTELVEVLACATEKLSLDCESQSSKLNEHFLSGSGSRPTRRKLLLPSSLICTTRFPGLGSIPSPLVSLMQRLLTS